MAKLIRQNLEAKLAALDGAEWDSMSEDSNDSSGDEAHDALTPPPLPLRAQKKEKRKGGKAAAGSVVPVGPAGQPSGVVYIGHIPHGFYEEAMNGFFKQFGDVIRVRLAHSKRTGRCKGYAYVEFASPEVAGIVAETMNGYFLFNKQLVCRVLRFDEIHANLFDGAGIKFRKVDWHGLYRKKYNADRTPSQDKQHTRTLVGKDKAKRSKLAALGIDYDFPGFEAGLKDRQVAPGPFKSADTPQEKPSKKRKAVDESAGPATPATPTGASSAEAASPSAKPATAKKTSAKVTWTATPAKTTSAKKTSSAKVARPATPGKPASAKKTPTKVAKKTVENAESPASTKNTPAKVAKTTVANAESPASAKKTPAKVTEAVTPPSKATKRKKSPDTKAEAGTVSVAAPAQPLKAKKTPTKVTKAEVGTPAKAAAKGKKSPAKVAQAAMAASVKQTSAKKTPAKGKVSGDEETPSKEKTPAAAVAKATTPKSSGKKKQATKTPPSDKGGDGVAVGSAVSGKGKRKSAESPVAVAATPKKVGKKRSAQGDDDEEPVASPAATGGARGTPKRAKRAKA